MFLLLLLLSANPELEFTSQFHRTEGWTGADGAYSVALADGRTLWLFSDTFVGSVVEGRRHPTTRFLHNSLALQQGRDIQFVTRSLFEPPDGRGWFWMYDGLEQGDGVELLLGQFETTEKPGALGFRAVGLWGVRLKLGDPLEVEDYYIIPYFGPGLHWGSCLMEHDSSVYIYGVKEDGPRRQAVIARATTLRRLESWSFFDGEGWSRDPSRAQAVAEEVSMEYSVHQTRLGDFAMVSSGGGISAEVQVRRGESPEGPWSDPVTVYIAPEAEGDRFAYNAKAHPELSDERGLLVSYNVNTLDDPENFERADIYRPRFLRIPDRSLLPSKKKTAP